MQTIQQLNDLVDVAQLAGSGLEHRQEGLAQAGDCGYVVLADPAVLSDQLAHTPEFSVDQGLPDIG
ncbi:hypothetical protein OHB35_14935 [Streptomyces phaeochromogenes]|uniref:Uncharacterized protein n=1 Tax=Streptomyces phaeochromogenes TaxID=1923 RepID=A0ABZ1HU03_STRPH|nr:hypothetical protein [Streptomyces phaeochromogenes]WSD22050.1 hypothetical protein OHB35_14935 [Streptomyces phaeochromogenes]